MKKNPIACLMALTMLLTGCAGASDNNNTDVTTAAVTASVSTVSTAAAGSTEAAVSNTTTTAAATQPITLTTTAANGSSSPVTIQYMTRPNLLATHYTPVQSISRPAQNYLTPNADLSNVYFGKYGKHLEFGEEIDGLRKEEYDALKKNGFFITNESEYEYFELYESNRYDTLANYVTVDSMMHTYHLYFQHLMKSIEKEQLYQQLSDVSKQMMKNAQAQLNDLKGSEWENAAKMELAFFTVGACLLDISTQIPAEVKEVVTVDLKQINDAKADESNSIQGLPLGASAVFPEIMEDFTQYKPRGYYTETDQLKRYFRAMMWYGRIGMQSKDETMNRCALLTTLAMDGDALQKWSNIYTVTSFFAGSSDDLGYYEFKPLIDAIYGKDAAAKNLIGDATRWQQFNELCKALPAPQINSVAVWEDETDEEAAAQQKGFRFMGQRFTLDAAAFTKLVYRQIEENDKGEKRLLPNALDFPAALGNETALQIVKDAGQTNYPNYMENLESVRNEIKNAPESTWNASLYSNWIYTLLPSIEEKDASYPPVMRTDAWKKKALITFEGSYTELKHDTVLYAKQVMGEMGGGPEDNTRYDDRGYVEAEPVVFGRLKALVKATSEGLDEFKMLSAKDKENLATLADLAGKLETIANKELAKELPTDEEFDLIRCYGGQLEHFWEDVMKADFPDESYISSQLHQAALITDIATDPNGRILEVATGNPIKIGVIVEVDGQLKLATGSMFSFYQFEQDMNDGRMTDDEWRIRQGFQYGETESKGGKVALPNWTDDIIIASRYDN